MSEDATATSSLLENIDTSPDTESTAFSDSASDNDFEHEQSPKIPLSKGKDADDQEDDLYLQTSTLGCYEMIEEISRSRKKRFPGVGLLEHVEGFREDWPYVARFLGDCAEQGGAPLLALWLIARVILAASPAISLYFSARLMNFIQALIRQETGKQIIGFSEFYHVAGSVLVWRLLNVQADSVFERHIERPLQHRINSFFQERLFQARARLDLPTSSDPIVEARFGDIGPDWVKDQGWRMLSTFAVVPSSIFSIIAQISVLYGLIQSEGGGWFAIFAAVGPILDFLTWNLGYSRGRGIYYIGLPL
ncbi:hypothetical protein DL93DRAFT_1972807 [Clavulina sp. PMI_390]|nr:hypothetical protein DL93DRAFT_1972807 [Clavulina sp. PMI_390]